MVLTIFLIKNISLQHLLQHQAEFHMQPQLSHVGYLLSICNLIMISCYANIIYRIMRSRFQLPYKVNPYVQFFTNLRSSMTLSKSRLTQLEKPNQNSSIIFICSIKSDHFQAPSQLVSTKWVIGQNEELKQIQLR